MWSICNILNVLSILPINVLATGDNIFTNTNTSGIPNHNMGFAIPASQPPPGGNWLGFGGDVYNNHWAGTDGLVDVHNVQTLGSVCQKRYEPGVSAAPLIENNVAYYNTMGGMLVALDYTSCKTIWKLNVTRQILNIKGDGGPAVQTGRAGGLISRSTPVVDGDVIFIGTLARALVFAVNKHTGNMIDSLQLSTHPFSILTQSPTLYNHRLFIGVSTSESGMQASDPTYTLSHHGSMHLVELRYGRLSSVWTTAMIPPGANFSGASVWGSQPSIDPIRKQVYIGTGQLFSVPLEFDACQEANKNLKVQTDHLAHEPCLPRNVYQTSVLALDIDTGAVNWYRTLGPLDAWNAACIPDLYPGGNAGDVPGPNCPKNIGNDTDFGMAPAFVLGSEYTPNRKDIVVAGQKSGNLYALSAQTGALLWTVAAAPGGLEGGLSWGVAVDSQAVYYTGINSDRLNYTLLTGKETSNSLFGAVNLKDGSIKWQVVVPGNRTSTIIPIVVNDVVLTGSSGSWEEGSIYPAGSGSFIAINKLTGEIIEERMLDGLFHAGIATVNDYVMFGTGYGGFQPSRNGSFNVWKLGAAPLTGSHNS